MKYVIIGNGAAGISRGGGNKKARQKGSITVISDEPTPLTRPLISYFYKGTVTQDKMPYKSPSFMRITALKQFSGKAPKK